MNEMNSRASSLNALKKNDGFQESEKKKNCEKSSEKHNRMISKKALRANK